MIWRGGAGLESTLQLFDSALRLSPSEGRIAATFCKCNRDGKEGGHGPEMVCFRTIERWHVDFPTSGLWVSLLRLGLALKCDVLARRTSSLENDSWGCTNQRELRSWIRSRRRRRAHEAGRAGERERVYVCVFGLHCAWVRSNARANMEMI